MATKKAAKPAMKDLKTSRKQLSKEEADAVKGGALLRRPIMLAKDPSKTYPSTDITHTEDDDVDTKTD